MNIKIKLALIWVLSLTTCFTFLQAADKAVVSAKTEEQMLRDYENGFDDCDDCETKLKISNLCAKRIKAIKGRFKELCADNIRAETICVDDLTINNDLNIDEFCTQQLTTNDLCVTGTARINETCGLYRAFARYSIDTTYTLGTLLSFDNILDDPNGNLTTAPTEYTIPVSGYYVVDVQVDQIDLTTPSGVILGTPTAVLGVLVNGILTRSSYFPFLTFGNVQNSTITSLVRLNQGDKVTANYRILAIDQTLGLIDLPGEVTVKGGTNASIFAIHYLSSNCADATCQPCIPSTTIPCNTVCCEPRP